MESGYYPPGAEYDSNAPYNQTELPEKDIEVTISVTLSKTVKVTVDDYKVERDDYGKFLNYDFSECNVAQAVEDQVVLPQNHAEYVSRIFEDCLDLKAIEIPKYLKDAISDCKNWDIDDLEYIIND